MIKDLIIHIIWTLNDPEACRLPTTPPPPDPSELLLPYRPPNYGAGVVAKSRGGSSNRLNHLFALIPGVIDSPSSLSD